MESTILFDSDGHRNVLLPDFGADDGHAVQANQHLIVHNGEGMILDPGGHKIYSKVMAETMSQIGGGKLRYMFASHQDPDIVASTNGWLMTTDVQCYVSQLWVRFIPHFGVNKFLQDRMHGIPDEGMMLELGGCDLMIIPAHFMHSCGNFQVYDPVSKILYSGDLGASLGQDYIEVPDFDAHLQYMEGFHRRYIASRRIMEAWANMVRELDIEIIAPQHGALFRGKEVCDRFINWCSELDCGLDLLVDAMKLPTKS